MGDVIDRWAFGTSMQVSRCTEACGDNAAALAAGLYAIADDGMQLIFALWLLAAVFLFTGYAIGRRAWLKKFEVNLKSWSQGTVISGRWTELALVTYTAILVIIVNKLSPDVRLVDFLTGHWHVAAAIVVSVYAITLFHSHRVVANIPAEEQFYPEYLRDLARGYRVYNLYSTLIFSLGLVTAVMVGIQFMADHAAFIRNRTVLDQVLNGLAGQAQTASVTPAALQSQIEQANSMLLHGVQTIIEQINTLFLMFFFVLAIDFLIEFTPVKDAFTDEGVNSTHMGVIVVLAVVLLFAWYLYYSQYLGLMQQAIWSVASLEARFQGGDWQVVRRYYDVLNELRNRQGISGFALTLSSERGGLLVLLGALQYMFTERKRHKRDRPE